MPRSLAAHAAHLLTGTRVLMTPAFVSAIACADHRPRCGIAAAVLFVVAAASDIVDGRVARRYGSASNAGRTFDHLADITFILAALSTYTALGIAPWWVPGAVGSSFAFYVVDSWTRAPGATPILLGSWVGHLAGIFNYAVIGIVVFNETAGIHLLPPTVLELVFGLVPIYSGAAVLTRLSGRRLVLSLPDAA